MKTKRALAWIVAGMMLLMSVALSPAQSIAEEAPALEGWALEEPTDSEEPKAVVGKAPEPAAPVDDIPLVPAASADDEAPAPKTGWSPYSGQCGPKLYWSFDPVTGALTITGSGEMDYGFSLSSYSWFLYIHQIISVTLPEGLTAICEGAFYDHDRITSITLPSKVKTVGADAFRSCTNLTAITIPKSVTRIDAGAFSDCGELKHVYYQGTVADRVKICIQSGNDALLNATWHYSKPNTDALAIKTQPKDVKADEGKTAVFTVKVKGATTVQWQRQAPGASAWLYIGVCGDSCSVLASTLFNGYKYRCVVSNGKNTLYSTAATLTVKPVKLAIKSHPKTVTVKENEIATFTVDAVGATWYEWFYKEEIAGAQWQEDYTQTYHSPSFSTFATVEGSEYSSFADGLSVFCRVHNDRGEYVDSKVARLYIKIDIDSNPKSVKVNEGEIAKFSVKATGGWLRWECRFPGEAVWRSVGEAGIEIAYYDVFTDSSTELYIPAYAAYDGVAFRCKIFNCTKSKYSSTAKLTVKHEELVIKSDPEDCTVEAGKKVTFKIKAAGASDYTWQIKEFGSDEWREAFTGSDIFSFTASARDDGASIRCVVANARGDVLCSREAKLAIKISIKKQPKTVTVTRGEIATFTVDATGVTNYQWQCHEPLHPWYDIQDSIIGATVSHGTSLSSISIDTKDVPHGLTYRCKLSNNTSTVYTSEVNLKINPRKPVITQQPMNASALERSTVQFCVTATGDELNYQWQYRQPGSSKWQTWPNGNTAVLSLTAHRVYDSYQFRCKVFNSVSNEYSDGAMLKVNDVPRSYRALLIGENDYLPPSEPLTQPVNNMYAMESMLKGLANSFTTKTLPNSSKMDIMEAIPIVFAGATDDDVSLFYFSGHGAMEDGSLSTIGSAVSDRYISFEELAEALSHVKGRVIVILDSCYSGAAIGKSAWKSKVPEARLRAYNEAAIRAFSPYKLKTDGTQGSFKTGELAQSKFVVITAANRNEPTLGEQITNTSFFTNYFIVGMGCNYNNDQYSGSMPADKNRDSIVTLGEMYDYLRSLLMLTHPQFYGDRDEMLFRR